MNPRVATAAALAVTLLASPAWSEVGIPDGGDSAASPLDQGSDLGPQPEVGPRELGPQDADAGRPDTRAAPNDAGEPLDSGFPDALLPQDGEDEDSGRCVRTPSGRPSALAALAPLALWRRRRRESKLRA